MTINFKVPEIKELKPRILVLGVGGAGGNAINEMIDAGVDGVEFVAVNTDAQDLKTSKSKTRIQIGLNLTKGLGAGAKHEIGQAAADESLNDIVDILKGANMVFITAGMGGGTGTGAAHVIARAAKELNILTVGVVTLPFLYEAPSRMRRAQQGLEELRKHVDTIIVIPNQNLFKIANEQTTYKESFQLSNSILRHGVQSVTDLMVKDGLVNLDFADVETVMSSMGKAMMGTGEAEGENRADKATELALNNPLIDDYSLKGAKGLLINITGGEDLKLFEVDEIVNKIRSEVDSEAEIINGSIIDPSLDGKIRVSIVATALDGQQPESKSVINMVHRIQNRNPGYSDFSSNGTGSFSFSNTNSNPISHGANALKLENEIVSENMSQQTAHDDINQVNNEYHKELLKNQEVENIVENTLNDEEISFTKEATNTNELSENNEAINNDLSEFGVDTKSPDLFSNDSEISNSDELLLTENEDQDEDDLEIPAFLRRQKN
ncbi:cell division protein FtsZ [Candidatus Pelagibacter communis]|uniref:cell division protein FtsZ n=1 Tax=Pelagibacter ubique TaxID=198252 RepID=UPI00094CA9B1|nr:cell division protein FtsZ [Candidatus Pelagibacter ubique]